MVESTTHHPSRAGFTLVELMIGMVVTGLTMAAIAGLMTAVAEGWEQTEDTQLASNTTGHAHLRIQRHLKAARLFGACRVGALDGTASQQAAILFWKGDANLDNEIQFSELALIEYHPDGDPDDPQTVRLYQVVWPSGWTEAMKTAADTTIDDNNEIFQDAEIDLFRGFANVAYSVLAKSISGAEFHKTDGSTVVRPRLEYLLVFPGGETEYGTAGARAPNTLPKDQLVP